MKNRKRSFSLIVILTLVSVLLTSCASYDFDVSTVAEKVIDYNYSSGESATYSKQNAFYDASEEIDLAFDAEAGSVSISQSSVLYEKSDRKIIYTSSAEIETKEYENAVKSLKTLCEKYNAYFESSTAYNGGIDTQSERHSEYTIRIPIDNYSAFLSEVGTIGTITSSGENNRDITEQYYDTEARLESAKLREERVLVLLENAGSLDDILALERELSDIRYEIESYTGSLRKYDSLISYATFTLDLYEVIEYTKPTPVVRTFGDKMSQSFKNGLDGFVGAWQSFAIFLSYNTFNIITLALVAAIIAVLIIALKKRKKKNTPNEYAPDTGHDSNVKDK